MLKAPHRPSGKLVSAQIIGGAAVFTSEYSCTRLLCYENGILRLTTTRGDSFCSAENPYFIKRAPLSDISLKDEAEFSIAVFGTMQAVVSKRDGAFSISLDGNTLFRQPAQARLEAFNARMIDRASKSETEQVSTADGVKTLVRDAPRVDYKTLYRVRLPLQFAENEALFGLGQIDAKGGNLRGRKLFMCHTNRQIALPFFVSTAGYGILINCACPFVFDDSGEDTSIYLEAVDELDYYIIPGKPDDAVKKYHNLTGKPSLLPAWAFGYVQSQERYETQQEILDLARKYRENGIGLDCVVLDWCSWPDKQWGQKSFDSKRFPDPKGMTDSLNQMDVHFMLSIWPNMNRLAPNNLEFKEKGWLLPGGEHYDVFNPAARDLYWRQANTGLFSKGVDAWWCDSSEPWTSEWEHKEMPLWEDTFRDTFQTASDAVGADKAMGFAFHHAKTMYEGQRSVSNDKRVLNLTRSAWTGQQRLGTVMWSGDICAKWKTLRNQISQGAGFSASGMPYWTNDIGGFFVKRGDAWYWDGDFEKGLEDPEYCELFIRWYQYAAFLPMFRGHGTDIRRDLTQFTGKALESILKFNRLRYKLLPYLYTLAGECALIGGTIIKPLAFNYPEDKNAVLADEEFMLGDSLIVCPVTRYQAKTVEVYLPEGLWYELETKKLYKGSKSYSIPCSLMTMPVFVKQGSVLPVSKGGQCVREALEAYPSLLVFCGCDGSARVYRDALDGYGYENGEYSLKMYFWNDADNLLTDENGVPVEYISFVDEEGGLF
ncbi:MAG: glycoside hydrolase [Clostridiales bacterium]|nr:glycoside hydrolase [Clostridiales bacterium]